MDSLRHHSSFTESPRGYVRHGADEVRNGAKMSQNSSGKTGLPANLEIIPQLDLEEQTGVCQIENRSLFSSKGAAEMCLLISTLRPFEQFSVWGDFTRRRHRTVCASIFTCHNLVGGQILLPCEWARPPMWPGGLQCPGQPAQQTPIPPKCHSCWGGGTPLCGRETCCF